MISLFRHLAAPFRRQPRVGAYQLDPPLDEPAGEDWRQGSRRGRFEMPESRVRLGDVFAPTHPTNDESLFAGRGEALERISFALEEQRAHVVLYGDRGIGKTSLARVLERRLEGTGHLILSSSCGATTRFSELFRALLSDIPQLYLKEFRPNEQAGESQRGLDEMLPDGDFGARELSDLLAELVVVRIVIMLDEYDRVENTDFHREVAETIKNLSDRAAPVSLVIIGVSDTLESLVGHHPSIRRHIVGIPVRRMRQEEMEDVIARGASRLSLLFTPQTRSAMIRVADGSPYALVTMCLFAAHQTLSRGSRTVEVEDLLEVAPIIVSEADEDFTRIYRRLTGNSEGELWARLVNAASDVAANTGGRITVAAVTAAMRKRGHTDFTAAQARSLLSQLASPDIDLLTSLDGEQRAFAFTDPVFPFLFRLSSLAAQSRPAAEMTANSA